MHPILVLVLCLLLLLTLPSMVTTLLMYYEQVNAHEDRDLAARSPLGMPGVLLTVLLTDIWAQILVILSLPLAFTRNFRLPSRESQAPTGPVDKDMPVLMIHGLYHNASAWSLFRMRLARAGYGRLFCYSYNSFFGAFDDLEDQLARAVERIARLYPDKRIALVGHSLGGLLIRSYLARAEAPDMVACAVILGAPHKGSRLAAFGIGPLARSLRYDGQLARSVAAKGNPHDIPRLSVFTPADNYVTGPDALHVLGDDSDKWQELVLPPMSHVLLPYDGATTRHVIAFFDQQDSDPPLY